MNNSSSFTTSAFLDLETKVYGDNWSIPYKRSFLSSGLFQLNFSLFHQVTKFSVDVFSPPRNSLSPVNSSSVSQVVIDRSF